MTLLEQDILKGLVGTLERMGSQFCCGGSIYLARERTLRQLYGVGDNNQARRLDLPPANLGMVEKLLDACAPSAHGRRKEKVSDKSYRLAHELHQEHFALTTDILNESGVLESITALTSPRTPKDSLMARLYKLNAYTTGGFFKPHRDTPKSDRHIGTLVVALSCTV